MAKAKRTKLSKKSAPADEEHEPEQDTTTDEVKDDENSDVPEPEAKEEIDGDADDAAAGEQKRKRKRKRKSKAAVEDDDEPEDAHEAASASRGSGVTGVTSMADPTHYHNDRTVYVEGIPYTASEEDVQQFFAACGPVLSLRMPRYQDSGRPRGYAHVEFKSKEQADAAIQRSGEYLHDRYLTIDRCNAPRAMARMRTDTVSQPPGCKTLFVKNLPYTVTEDEVRQAFMVFGKIASVRLAVWGHTQKLKGFGYVEFQAENSAAIAMKKASEIVVQGRRVICDFDTGAPKGSYKTPEGQPWQKAVRKSKTK